MHKGFESGDRQASDQLSGEGPTPPIRYEIERLADKHDAHQTHVVDARDLYDAIRKARQLIGVGEVRIRRDGRQVCYLHLQSATRWWVELSENAG
ncbi:hypothetical protein [Aurantiacibacter sp. MUD61]|uniref:hypothetical protein n=1 Tax=Aurantiacibacter sp. MUD61 TaxID=3009083 RepID=UPI0022F0F109|nr:hypothetical protein [Aurantiacibacter sp. MUD61]